MGVHGRVYPQKKGGGRRPIILLSFLLRIHSRLRQPIVREWQSRQPDGFYWGTKDQSCEQAGWLHHLLMAYSRRHGLASASVLADLAQYYEYVDHEMLKEEAVATSFNPEAASCALRCQLGLAHDQSLRRLDVSLSCWRHDHCRVLLRSWPGPAAFVAASPRGQSLCAACPGAQRAG